MIEFLSLAISLGTMATAVICLVKVDNNEKRLNELESRELKSPSVQESLDAIEEHYNKSYGQPDVVRYYDNLHDSKEVNLND